MQCRVMPYEGSEPYIFFSYCHKNASQVYPIIETMAQTGFRIWYDDGIHPGDDWLEVIADHLCRSSMCIAAITPESAASHNCRSEINLAMDQGKCVVSIMMEDFPLSPAAKLLLGASQYIRRFDYPTEYAFYERLYSAPALSACLGAPQPLLPTPEELLRTAAAEEAERQRKAAEEAERQHKAAEEAERQRKAAEDAERQRKAAEEAERQRKAVEQLIDRITIDSASFADDIRTAQNAYNALPSLQRLLVQNYEKLEHAAEALVHTVRAPSLMPAVLLYPAGQEIYPLTKAETVLGRSRTSCDVAFPGESSVSRTHAKVLLQKDSAVLVDAHSANGTFVNEVMLAQDGRIKLENLTRIQLHELQLIFICGDLAQKILQNRSTWLLRWNGGQVIPTTPQTDLGRYSQANPTGIADPKVSRIPHARVHLRNDRLFLQDTHSTNGTHMNGVRLETGKEYPLYPGCTFRVGDTEVSCLYLQLTEREDKT